MLPSIYPLLLVLLLLVETLMLQFPIHLHNETRVSRGTWCSLASCLSLPESSLHRKRPSCNFNINLNIGHHMSTVLAIIPQLTRLLACLLCPQMAEMSASRPRSSYVCWVERATGGQSPGKSSWHSAISRLRSSFATKIEIIIP